MKIKINISLFFIIFLNLIVVQADDSENSEQQTPYHKPSFYPGRTGIVQLFQWPFKAIARECETFLGPNGYAAVQTSPVHENRIIPGRFWYELYQPISYRISTRLGDEDDFRDMIKRCDKSGIRIIVDVLPNHMSDVGATLVLRGQDGSIAVPAIRWYPAVPYTLADFHKTCYITNWNNKEQYRNCQLLTLPDLDQSNEHVRKEIVKMMNHLLKLGVAGFRIDAASFMDPADLKVIYSRLDNLNPKYNFPENTRPFIYQEAHNWKEDYTGLGRIIEFTFSFFVTNAMRGKFALKNYHDLGPSWGLQKSDDVIVDNDNHDSQRSFDLVTYREPTQFKMVTAFMLAYPYGIPKMMSSFKYITIIDGPPMDIKQNIIDPMPVGEKCEKNWNCEHRWKGIPEMVQFANVVNGEKVENFYGNDDGQMGFCRGNKGFIAFNSGKKNMNIEMNVCLPAGVYCDVATGEKTDMNKRCTGKTISVSDEGKATIMIGAKDQQRFLAIHQESRLN